MASWGSNQNSLLGLLAPASFFLFDFLAEEFFELMPRFYDSTHDDVPKKNEL